METTPRKSPVTLKADGTVAIGRRQQVIGTWANWTNDGSQGRGMNDTRTMQCGRMPSTWTARVLGKTITENTRRALVEEIEAQARIAARRMAR